MTNARPRPLLQTSTTPYLEETVREGKRKDALSWWRGMTPDDKERELEIWRAGTKHFAKNWTYSMIMTSDSVIEYIYRENVLQEKFENNIY